MAQNVKTVQGLAIASVKTLQGLAIASAKTILGVDNTGGSVLKDHEDTDSGGNQQSFDSHMATVFTAGSSYSLTSVDVFIARNLSGSQNFFIELRTNSAGDPGTVLATSDTVLASAVGSSVSWVAFNFSTPFSIVNGTTYWIDIRRNADDLQLYWESDSSAPIEGIKEGGPGAWTTITAVEVGMFRCYGT